MKIITILVLSLITLGLLGCSTYKNVSDNKYFWAVQRESLVETVKFCYIDDDKKVPICEEAEQKNLPPKVWSPNKVHDFNK